MRFILSAFADESGSTLTEQIAALKRNKYDYLEIRGMSGKNVSELTVNEAKEIASRLEDNGLSVYSVGSPIGKIPVNGDFDAHLELYKHTLEIAGVLGAKHIRLFSFYIPEHQNPEQYQTLVLERMGVFGEYASQMGIVACHENEKGIYGDIASRCEQIHKNCPKIKAVFDPANYIQCGQDTLQAWQMIAPYVEYLHIKDALPNGQVVPAGDGIGNLHAIIRNYALQGGSVLSLEPHLHEFIGFNNLEQGNLESIINRTVFESAESAFDYAAQKLYQLIKR